MTTLMKSKSKPKNSKNKISSKEANKSSKKPTKDVTIIYNVEIKTDKKRKSVEKSKKKSSVEPKSKEVKIDDSIVVKRDKNLDTYTETVDVNAPSVNLRVSDEDVKQVRRRGRNKKDKIYFSKATEEAIIEYNKETDLDIRNKIYNERIKFSFEKLVENIYNTFKFTYFDCGPLDVQRETVTHLVSNIHKFQEGKGKAFSYFSIVAKNYLIFHNNNNYKRFNQHVDISDTPTEDAVCLQSDDSYHEDVQTKEFMSILIKFWEDNINKIFKKPKDLNIAYAVLELYRNCDRIESFNKKTLYLYIREMSDCKTQQITKILNKMKSHQLSVVKNYQKYGTR